MDILIKGMEMPSCCGNCQFNQFHEANPWTTWETCTILDKDTDANGNGRLADCPLVALPEHGDLIDADVLDEKIKKLWFIPKQTKTEYMVAVEKTIATAPTIVEANNG